jgi:hypothetical protein
MNGANCNSKNNFVVKAVVLFGLATILFYLLTEYRAHLLAYSSYILFLGFVLLHVFMCGGHGKHEGHCGHGHREHKHGEAEKGIERGTGGHEDVDQREHSQEKFK